MKWSCLFLASFSLLSAAAQRADIPIRYFIDQSVRDYPQSSPALLVNELTAGKHTDLQKVTAIFHWITDNISYNVRALARYGSSYVYEEPDDTGMIIKPLNLRVAETVIRRKSAICDGYARLFKTMCDDAAIPCEVITGYARTGWDGRHTGFASNHTWNAVYIDSAWHLLDVTWASGFISRSGEQFIQHYDDSYFLTPPAQFVMDHYPEDVRWTLLKDAPVLSEFNQSPFRFIGYIKTGIHSYYPAKGTIEASIGDSLKFEALASINQGLLEVVSGNRPEDTIWNDDEPVPVIGKKKSCYYKVTEKSGPWLYVVCNGYVILRYNLRLRKRQEETVLKKPD